VTGYSAWQYINRGLKSWGRKSISLQTVYAHIKKGSIPSHVENGQLVVNKEDLDTWIENRCGPRR
jgi:predicted DNA-binding transcriptional regulator AlpA